MNKYQYIGKKVRQVAGPVGAPVARAPGEEEWSCPTCGFHVCDPSRHPAPAPKKAPQRELFEQGPEQGWTQLGSNPNRFWHNTSYAVVERLPVSGEWLWCRNGDEEDWHPERAPSKATAQLLALSPADSVLQYVDGRVVGYRRGGP